VALALAPRAGPRALRDPSNHDIETAQQWRRLRFCGARRVRTD
jgi:hypothetical protein